ncbi:hypothetical protein IWW39_004160 [Coemansia spiralis]|uniref:DUF4246 domain-containing protein n=1 Tax=Coemansia spiralis TaxID=417178 RepID=A0A9W8GCG1_9FUNG|nr:hypothetical protein IWW39_004160 [Coemansia spiralis]
MTTTSQKYLLKWTCLTHSDGYSTIGPYDPEPKTRVELCMIRASAAIRSTSDWVEQLHSDSKCSEWAAQVKKAFGLNRRETKYVFDELEYYAKLVANGRQGEEPGAVDMVWINRGEQDDQLAVELARNAELLEDDYTKERCEGLEGRRSFGRQVLVDPFLYAFSSDESQAFKKPITSPMEAVNSEVPRISPGVLWEWREAIKIVNKANSQSKNKAFDKREISWLYAEPKTEEGKLYASCWLPTDFDVGVDGSVSMRSYINNLHPVHHAELYQTISKVFAKCVPMLEQALTDAIHPHQSRDVFDESLCFKYGTPHPHDILQIAEKGESLPDKYKKFVTTSDSYCYGGKWNDTLVVNGIEIDTSALFNEWEKSRPATRHL